MKSKFKVLMIVSVLIIVGVLVAIPKSAYEKLFNSDKQNSNVVVPNTTLVYVKNRAGLIVGIEASIIEEVDDDIYQKWNVMTKNASSLPVGYTSAINVNTVLNEYVINQGVLELHVSEEIINSDGRKTAEALAWTYINEEINEVKLFVDDIEIKKINDYVVTKINKKMGINLEYETSYLFESISTTIMYYKEDCLMPVTYFHMEEDVCSYILDKTLLEASLDGDVDFDYELQEDIMVINFNNDLELTDDVLNSLTDSFKLNFSLNRLSINNVEKSLYDMVFNKIEE